MAYADKYKLEIADTLGIIWTVLIQEDGYGGSVNVLNGAGSPIVFEYYGDDDIYDQPIMGSKATITVNASTSFEYSDLFTTENLTYKVIIKQGSTVFWNGWILSNNYAESYNCPPYAVQITASDGLGLLSDFEFKDLAYTERQTVSQVLYDLLDLVGVTTFTEFVNLYESYMDSTVDDSPFDQTGIDPDLFKESNCYTALEEILKSFSANIRQDQGTFIIYRPAELKDVTMTGRVFTSGSAKSSTTRTPLQYVDRDAQASNFHDYEGGTLTMTPLYKKVIVNQNYGFKGSIFKNYNFPYEEFDFNSPYWSIPEWTQHGSTRIQPVSVTNANRPNRDNDEIEGMLIPDKNATTLDWWYYQTVTGRETTNKLTVEIQSSLLSDSGADDTGYMYCQLISTDGVTPKYFWGSVGTWDTTERYISEIADCGKDLNWKTYSYKFEEIPYTGDLTIILYGGFDHLTTPGNILCAYKNFNLYFTNDDGVVPEGIGYTILNTGNGQVKEMEIKLGDGYGFDNDPLQYAGVYNVWLDGNIVPTSKQWAVRGGEGWLALAQLVGQEYADQHARPKQLLDLPMRERHDDEFFKMVGNVQDTTNTYGGNNRVFAPCHGTFDVKNREWELSLIEIL